MENKKSHLAVISCRVLFLICSVLSESDSIWNPKTNKIGHLIPDMHTNARQFLFTGARYSDLPFFIKCQHNASLQTSPLFERTMLIPLPEQHSTAHWWTDLMICEVESKNGHEQGRENSDVELNRLFFQIFFIAKV